MALCTACSNVDYHALLASNFQECRHRQEAVKSSQLDETERSSEKYKHHGDIFEVENSARNCPLCKVIFETFEKRNIANREEARALPIVFRPSGSGIEVCYDTVEGLIKLCCFQVYMHENEVDKFFELAGIREDHSPPILRIMDQDSGSRASLRVASNWLQNCLNNHEACQPPHDLQKPPKRLIHVGSDSQNPFLEEMACSSKPISWVSLSYCWGKGRSMILDKDNLSQLKSGAYPLEKFDPAVQDAILVVRALEITYIWVDALCIFQDDNGKDWNEQASKMNEIYEGSILTLVVTSSESVLNRFLQQRDLKYTPLLRRNSQPGDINSVTAPATVFLSPEWDRVDDEIKGPWNTRGWTMQEGLLPNRTLHFKSSQMIWKCCEEQKFERGVTQSLQDVINETLTFSDDVSFGSGWIWKLDNFMVFKRLPDYLPVNLANQPGLSAEPFQLWYNLMEDYALRRFTKISDRLVAISGLAQTFSKMVGSKEYAAGLWEQDMIRGLLWHTPGSKLVPRRSEESIRTKINAFPSWSWLSVGYERVTNSQKHDTHFQALSRFDNVKIELDDTLHPFGAIKSGSITITGPLKRIHKLYIPGWRLAEEPMSNLHRHLSEIIENESSGSVDPRYSHPSGVHFAALQMLGEVHGKLELLVLESTGEVSQGHMQYIRVGVVSLHHFPSSSAASPELIATLAKQDDSLRARLGPPRSSSRKVKGANAVVEELRRQPWETETVVIV